MIDIKDNPRKILLGNDVNFIWNIVDANFTTSNPKVYIVTAMGKHSIAMSLSPTGGSWNSVTDVVTYPAGWSANDSSAGIVWMSTAIFGTTGIKGNWSIPVKISGNDGSHFGRICKRII